MIRAGTEGVIATSSPEESGAVSLVAISTELGSIPVVIGRSATSINDTDWSYDLGIDARVGQAVIGAEPDGFVVAIPVTNRGELWILHPGGDVGTIDVRGEALALGAVTDDSLSAYPVLVDFDLDGRLDVLVAYGNLLLAFSQSGALVRNFPVRVPAVVAAQPLIARFVGQTAWTVFAAAADGYLYAYDTSERQRLQPGFPLEVGNAALATPLIDEGILYAVSENGTTKAWRLPDVETVWWGKLFGSADNASFVDLRAGGSVDQAPPPLIDASETYNWPNPVENGITHLRTKTGLDSRVEITIIDAAGGLVAELEMNTRAGIPSEIAWEANVESGLYFARITATSVGGVKATKLVKMAVIR
ncbi:MAG: T9SS type A sorting domain-containing protein [Rhodothermales bacterium]